MKLVLKNEEIITACNALDLYIRFHLGQYDYVDSIFSVRGTGDNLEEYRKLKPQRMDLYQKIRDALIPAMQGYGFAGSLGIHNRETDDKARDAYDVLQCVRYEDTWLRHPEGGRYYEFWKPMICGRYPKPECKASGEPDCPVVTIDLCKEQMEIVAEAVEINSCVLQRKIREAFKYFTDREELLDIATEIEGLIKESIVPKEIGNADALLQLVNRAMEGVDETEDNP